MTLTVAGALGVLEQRMAEADHFPVSPGPTHNYWVCLTYSEASYVRDVLRGCAHMPDATVEGA